MLNKLVKEMPFGGFLSLLASRSCSADPSRYFIDHGGLTTVGSTQAQDLFLQTTSNSAMRMPSPNGPNGGGKCWQRAVSIENWLKDQNIRSGLMTAFCSGRHIEATDQMSGKVYYYYSDYHTVPVLLVNKDTIENLYVIDPQFESQLVELHAYLKKIIVNNIYKAFTKEDMGMPNKGDPCKWYIYSSANNLNTVELSENLRLEIRKN